MTARAWPLLERVKAEMKERYAFARAHGGESFKVPDTTDRFGFAVVSPETDRSGRWRVSRFDRRGPVGHSLFRSHADAVRDVGGDYDLGRATFAPAETRREACARGCKGRYDGAVTSCTLILGHEGAHCRGNTYHSDDTYYQGDDDT